MLGWVGKDEGRKEITTNEERLKDEELHSASREGLEMWDGDRITEFSPKDGNERWIPRVETLVKLNLVRIYLLLFLKFFWLQALCNLVWWLEKEVERIVGEEGIGT